MPPKGSKKAATAKKGLKADEAVEGALLQGLTLTMKQARVIHRRESKLNGDILVEELVVEGAQPGTVVRRMRFMSNLELEQTEVRLVIHPDGRAVADKDYLPYQCLQGMLLSLPLFPTRSAEEVAKEPMEILIVGLAGGMLPRYLRNTLPATNIDCVELDPAVADIAKEYFDLSADKGITVHVADGVDFVAAAPEDWYDLTLMDVNACDENDKILEAPPRPFITPEFINAWARTTRPGGVAAMNVLCSDPALFNTILLRIRDAFGGPVSFLKDHAEDADENYVVYVCKPVPGKPLEAPTSERVRAKLRLLEQQAPSLKQFNLSKRTAEQFNQFDPDAFP